MRNAHSVEAKEPYKTRQRALRNPYHCRRYGRIVHRASEQNRIQHHPANNNSNQDPREKVCLNPSVPDSLICFGFRWH